MLPEIPIYRSVEYESLDPDDPRRWQSMQRAADAWHADGTDEAIRNRLLAEIAFNDRFAAWRICMLSNDLSSATDWVAASRRRSWVELERLRSYEQAS
jgi:hypothetical protein